MGSDQTGRRNDDPSMISIHAPRMGSDHNQTGWGATIIKIAITVHIFKFQSTLPGWGATTRIGVLVPLVTHFNPRSPDGERRRVMAQLLAWYQISIHAPRMGSDITLTPAVCCPADFNPRSPDGERPGLHHLPAKVQNISIHAPRMGSDRGRLSRRNGCADFNPRSPDGERHAKGELVAAPADFNPRSPDGERPPGSNRL